MTVIDNKEKTDYKELIKLCINWGLGYFIIWVSKWILTDVILNERILKDAIDSLLIHTSAGIDVTIIDVIKNDFDTIKYEFCMLFIFTAFTLVYSFIKKAQINKNEIIPLILISLMPFVWFFVTQGHSYVHAKFVYRILLISFMAIEIIDYKILKKTCEKSKTNAKNADKPEKIVKKIKE